MLTTQTTLTRSAAVPHQTMNDRAEKQLVSLDALLDRLCSPQQLPGKVVFDLDRTVLLGDIGEASFRYLSDRGSLHRLPLLVDGACLSDSEDMFECYQKVVGIARGSQNTDELLGTAYAWMSRCLAGLSIAAVEQATEKGFEQSNIALSPIVMNAMARLLEAKHRAIIVSATNQTSVTWVVNNSINPRLQEMGVDKKIELSDVWGVNNRMRSGSTVRSTLLEKGSIHQIIEEDLIDPLPLFAGKAECLIHAGHESPLLVAGDSANDLSMLALGLHALWLGRNPHSLDTLRFEALMRRSAKPYAFGALSAA